MQSGTGLYTSRDSKIGVGQYRPSPDFSVRAPSLVSEQFHSTRMKNVGSLLGRNSIFETFAE